VKVQDKVCLVTGAARGMGEAIARRLIEDGATVVLGDVLVDEGKAVADELGDRAVFVPLDVTSLDDWTEAVDRAEREFGRLDVLVNNAGILRFGASTPWTRGPAGPDRGQPVRGPPRARGRRSGHRASRAVDRS
jgi:NAD(P)-dependent dehydrogenase (short-subunit alcohol dehydrogenase family)